MNNPTCPNCDCTEEKQCNTIPGKIIPNIYKCNTCYSYFADGKILKKKLSKLNAIYRRLTNV